MKVPQKIKDCHRTWARMAVRLQLALSILGSCAVISSITVATFTDELGIFGTRIAAAATAICIGVISFFQIQKKISDLWNGWRYLNASIMLFENNQIDISQLIERYLQAEKMIGVMEINSSKLGNIAVDTHNERQNVS